MIRLVRGTFGYLLLLSLTVAVSANEETNSNSIVRSAEITLKHFMNDPEMARFRELVPHAKGVFVAPDIWQAGAGIGGAGGSGVLLTRDKSSGLWRGPAFYSMGAGSLGLQLGVQKSELVLLVMSRDGVNAMLSSGLKLGVGASVAAGPVGKGASISTADILSYSRSKGLYGGLSLTGEVLSVNRELNKEYYGRSLDSVDILVRNIVSVEHSLGIIDLVNRLSSGL